MGGEKNKKTRSINTKVNDPTQAGAPVDLNRF